MNDNGKTLNMLDTIANQVQYLTENMATKDELRSFKEQTNHRFNQIDDRFDKLEADNNAAHKEIIAKIDKQSESFETKLEILNKRQFAQEVELSILKKKEAL